MSRDLTIYRGRRDQDPPGMAEKVERIMQEQGVSEPVARNLIKYSKFGIGPMASGQLPQPPPSLRPAPSMKDAAEERKRKLREQEERMQELEKQRSEEPRQAEEKPFSPFEQAVKPKAKVARNAPRLGLISLGKVQARPESIDPLLKVEVPPTAEASAGSDAQARASDDSESDGRPSGGGGATASQGKQPSENRRVFTEEAKRKMVKKKRKRRRDSSEEDTPREAGRAARDDVKGASREDARGGRDDARGGKDPAQRHARARSPSSTSQPPEAPPAPVRPSSSGSLMTEAQVKAMMGGSKGKKLERGSARAKARIQKEMQEWESTKNNNPEFWKAPKFALCYSAETTKNRNY